MRNIFKRNFLTFALVLIFMSSVALAAAANTVNVTINNNEIPLEETGQPGRVNWEQGNTGTIEAIGTGVVPNTATSFSQGKMLARRAAVVDAYRNLAEIINGVQVDSETTVANLAIANDTVKVRVSALVKGAKIVREIPASDGSYQVVMSINMYGVSSLAEIAINAVRPAEIQNFPQPSDFYTPEYKPEHKPEYTPHYPSENYTGVVIVAQNMGLKSTFSPRVYDENGNIVYGNKYIDPDFAIKHGMVDYSGLDAARSGNSRAGAKPLVVNALRVVDHDCNVVISNADAQKILAAHAQSGFLAKCAVVFAKQ